MAGLIQSLPEVFSFECELPIRITDLNYGNHVGNDRVLSLLHEARVQFLQHHGFSELDCAGTGLIMKDVIIEFKKEIKYGDTLMAYVAASNFTKVSFDIFYRLIKKQENTLAVVAKTGMLCFDYRAGKITAVPSPVREKLDNK